MPKILLTKDWNKHKAGEVVFVPEHMLFSGELQEKYVSAKKETVKRWKQNNAKLPSDKETEKKHSK